MASRAGIVGQRRPALHGTFLIACSAHGRLEVVDIELAQQLGGRAGDGLAQTGGATADLPARPLIGLLLRLLYQEYAQAIDAALREAGFHDVRPAAANVFPFVRTNVFPFVRPHGITVSSSPSPGAQANNGPGGRSTRARGVRGASPQPARPPRSRLAFLTERGASVPPVTHAAATTSSKIPPPPRSSSGRRVRRADADGRFERRSPCSNILEA